MGIEYAGIVNVKGVEMDNVEQLKAYIKDKGWTQKQMAEYLDVTLCILNRWLRGKSKISRGWVKVLEFKGVIKDN